MGVIRVSDRKGGFFTESDQRMLTLIASYISTAIAYCHRYEDRVKLLQKLQKLMVLTKGIPKLDIGVDAFEQAILDKAAKSAAEVLKTDVLTLYKYNIKEGRFETPPVWKGELRCEEFMNTPIHPDDIPWKILRGGSQYWEDAQHEPALIGAIPPRDGLPARPRFVMREQIRSSAGIRLEVNGVVVGIMFLNFRHFHAFDPAECEIIETFAGQVALSLEIARLYRQIQASAYRDEAAYLALELHDALLQILYYEVLVRAGLARERLGRRNYGEVEQDLKVIENAAKYCVEEARAIMGLQITHDVDDLGLVEGLRRFLEYWKPRHPTLQVDFQVNEVGQLPLDVQRHLYRIAQTAFSNVVAHAQASYVRIALDITSAYGSLSIGDNGVGFDPVAALQEQGKYGLSGIQRRVGALKGTMKIDSQPGRGTKIVVWIPAVYTQLSPTGIRVFLVEDSPFGVASLQRTIDETPEGDLRCVGTRSQNTPDLLDLIEISQADVVLTDIVLGDAHNLDPSEGIAAIQAIRQKFGENIKILGFTAFPHFKELALKAGADDMVFKGANIHEIRQAIRAYGVADRSELCPFGPR
jgi:signal transduction histidine kinase